MGIANPDFVDDPSIGLYSSFGVAAFEIWQVKAGTIFDNVIITDDPAEAKAFGEATFEKNKDAEKTMYDKKQEEERKKAEEARKAEEEDDEDEDEEDDDNEDD